MIRTDHSPRGFLPSVVCPMSVIAKLHKGRLWPGIGSKRHKKVLKWHNSAELSSTYTVHSFRRLQLWRLMGELCVFPYPHCVFQIHNSTESQVVLKSVNLSSTGRYRCEVSAEAPSFQTVSDHGDMTVVGKSKYTFTLLGFTLPSSKIWSSTMLKDSISVFFPLREKQCLTQQSQLLALQRMPTF